MTCMGAFGPPKQPEPTKPPAPSALAVETAEIMLARGMLREPLPFEEGRHNKFNVVRYAGRAAVESAASLLESAFARVRAEERERCAKVAAPKWISVSEGFPGAECHVLAFVPGSGRGGSRRVRAYYAPARAVEAMDSVMDSVEDLCEYDEARDCYWLGEGWYESNEYEDTHWRVGDPVTHWMPLPEAPRTAAIRKGGDNE